MKARAKVPHLALQENCVCTFKTLYSIITPFDTFEIMENGANVPFSIVFSKVFKTLLNFFLIFFPMLSKNRK